MDEWMNELNEELNDELILKRSCLLKISECFLVGQASEGPVRSPLVGTEQHPVGLPALELQLLDEAGEHLPRVLVGQLQRSVHVT